MLPSENPQLPTPHHANPSQPPASTSPHSARKNAAPSYISAARTPPPSSAQPSQNPPHGAHTDPSSPPTSAARARFDATHTPRFNCRRQDSQIRERRMLTRRGSVAVSFLRRRRHSSMAWHVCAIDRAQACCVASMEVLLPPGCMEMAPSRTLGC